MKNRDAAVGGDYGWRINSAVAQEKGGNIQPIRQTRDSSRVCDDGLFKRRFALATENASTRDRDLPQITLKYPTTSRAEHRAQLVRYSQCVVLICGARTFFLSELRAVKDTAGAFRCRGGKRQADVIEFVGRLGSRWD